MEIANESVKTYAMDHHGIVASICRDLKIADKIDKRLDNSDPRRIVTAGTAVVALILNGLGFTNRRLYLTPQFFESKPVELLLGKNIQASQLDDNILGKALDEISAYGSSKLFGEMAFEIALENNLLSDIVHMDTTSLSVDGEYKNSSDDEGVVHLTYGHSKDHRPDLKQVIMSLIVSGKSAMPLWMEPQNGNSSDKTSFHETIARVRSFQSQLNSCPDFKWIADSALYHKEKLLKTNDYLWVSRVPETIKEARTIVEKNDSEIDWELAEKGCKISEFTSCYGDISQRWLLVYSEQAYQRELNTFHRNLTKKDNALKKILWHLGNSIFSCESDAEQELKKIRKKHPYHIITKTIEPILKYEGSGRPKIGQEKKLIGYSIKCEFEHNDDSISKTLNKKGRFILATNDLDTTSFPNSKILSEYKNQQGVERGFRFLKDPWFMVDSIFLKSPRRIEALMMVMTLCLMVYNIGQYKLREKLKEENETLPNQINKQIQTPTLRWIFQMMEGVAIIEFKEVSGEIAKTMITNLTELRMKIVRLLGNTAQEIYGIT